MMKSNIDKKHFKKVVDLETNQSWNYIAKISSISLIIVFSFITCYLYRQTLPIQFNFISQIDLLSSGLKNLGSHGKIFSILLLLIIFFIPIIVMTIFEMIILFSRNNPDFKETSIGRMTLSEGKAYSDLWYFALNQIVIKFPFLVVFLTFGTSLFPKNLLNFTENFYLKFIAIPDSPFLSSILFFVAILLVDLADYFAHRLAHHIPFIWDFHEFHHSATEMTIFSGRRNAILQDVPTSLILFPLNALTALLIAGFLSKGILFPCYIYLIHLIFKLAFGYLGHSSLKIIYPKPLSLVYMSPALHWLHHSDNPKHHDCNFGESLVIWDKIFGTFLGEENLKDIDKFGVKGTKYNSYHPLYSFAILPINLFFKRLKTNF